MLVRNNGYEKFAQQMRPGTQGPLHHALAVYLFLLCSYYNFSEYKEFTPKLPKSWPFLFISPCTVYGKCGYCSNWPNYPDGQDKQRANNSPKWTKSNGNKKDAHVGRVIANVHFMWNVIKQKLRLCLSPNSGVIHCKGESRPRQKPKGNYAHKTNKLDQSQFQE